VLLLHGNTATLHLSLWPFLDTSEAEDSPPLVTALRNGVRNAMRNGKYELQDSENRTRRKSTATDRVLFQSASATSALRCFILYIDRLDLVCGKIGVWRCPRRWYL
jgi:hypothetical protein